jgi:feruloyl esterase
MTSLKHHEARIPLVVGVGYLLCLAPCAFPASPALECKDLASLKVPRTTIVSAELVEAGTFKPPGGAPLPNLKAFCRVAGIATPSSDSDIKFEVWLPAAEWNGRLWGVGNGNFAGYMPYKSLGAQLAEGYAAVGTDTGHEAGPTDANWAIGHPEKLADYGYRAVHEMTVRAKRIVTEFYGRNPARSYFSGCSNGGRQGLMEAQRYPDDYDGILAGAPVLDQTHLNEFFAWIDFVVLGENAANLPSSKLPAIQAAALAACDRLDGVEDGVIDSTLASSSPELRGSFAVIRRARRRMAGTDGSQGRTRTQASISLPLVFSAVLSTAIPNGITTLSISIVIPAWPISGSHPF